MFVIVCEEVYVCTTREIQKTDNRSFQTEKKTENKQIPK